MKNLKYISILVLGILIISGFSGMVRGMKPAGSPCYKEGLIGRNR